MIGGDVVALCFFPRLFLGKGESARTAVVRFIEGKGRAAGERGGGDPVEGWVRRVGNEAAGGSPGAVARVLEGGVSSRVIPGAGVVEMLYPARGGGAGVGLRGSEGGAVRGGRGGKRSCIAASDVRRWARSHRDKSGGVLGWTGRLLLAADGLVEG